MASADPATLSNDEIARMRKILDRQDIQDCLARVARGTDRFDRDLFLSGFHPEALISAGNTTSSPQDIYEGGRAMHDEGTFATLHCLSTSTCQIEGDTAHAETYHIYAARNRDETNWAAAGRYIDQLERRDGVWGIVFRHIVVEWAGKMQPHVIAMFEGVEEKELRLRPSRGRDDVSYLRPLRS